MPAKKLTHAQIRPVKERIEDELLSRPGVTGVDINEKVSNGKPTGELSIVVYVEKKKPKSRLSAGEAIPAEIDGIPTDVKEEKIELQADRVALADIVPFVDATKYTTLHGGISMGPCRSVHLAPPDVPSAGDYVFVGTLGVLVSDRTTKAAMALTNFHVACIDSGWAVGNARCQPGRVDGGSCPGDTIGSLTRAALSNHVDGAVVTLQTSRATDCSIEQIGDVKGHTTAVLNSAVRKRGRTTGLTFGTVDSIDVSVTINYGDGLGNHTLKNQIRVLPDTNQSPKFSDHGDSGSAGSWNRAARALTVRALPGQDQSLSPTTYIGMPAGVAGMWTRGAGVAGAHQTSAFRRGWRRRTGSIVRYPGLRPDRRGLLAGILRGP